MSYATDTEIRQVVSQLRALDREIAVLHREHDRAPRRFASRTKAVVSEQMSYLVGRREECLRRLEQLKQERDRARSACAPRSIHGATPRPHGRSHPGRRQTARETTRPVHGPTQHPGPSRSQQGPQQRSGMHKVQLQRSIDDAYTKIGELGQRIATMPITPERKALIIEHQKLIQQRRRWIAEINAL